MVIHKPDRDVRPEYLGVVREWLERSGEVFVLLRYLAAAGAKGYAFCRTFAEFERLVAAAPEGADIVVFRERQLPHRGVVTPEFASAMLAAFPDQAEYLLITLETLPDSLLSQRAAGGDTPEDLRDILEEFSGVGVAFGPWPDFAGPDSDNMVSATKGGIDGPR